MAIKIILTLGYLCVIFYLAFKGWRETKQASDYMLAGRQMHPFVMAMSYGATFISTSAIIGFGGAAGMFGFPLLWLTFLNIMVGIFIAMVFLGKRTRRMGVSLGALTFPELMGRRYQSRFVQGFAGVVIFLFIPVYAAAVLIGIARMMEVNLGISYAWALFSFTAILAVYVITGGLKGVMYTEAFQGSLMFGMMMILLFYTYGHLGGLIDAHKELTGLAGQVPAKLKAMGMLGWTQGAEFGSPLWLIIYTTIVYGVGIGVLAQPQLAVRFMTVNSDRDLNRAVLYGGIFLLSMTGVAFVVGALSNVMFFRETGEIAIQAAGGNMDKIIPVFITDFLPDWFGILFLLAMFAAAMSTLASQYHAGGTSLGRDFYERAMKVNVSNPVALNRGCVGIIIVVTLFWSWILPPSIIARATAFFFGLCAASFLPAYFMGLYWKGTTLTGAITSMVGGFFISLFYLLFVHTAESGPIGLCQALFGVKSLAFLADKGTWLWNMQFVDPNIVALPLSIILCLLVSLTSKKMDQTHIQACWSNI
ncbi:sodium:solute symporter family protein [Dethiosulfatarculus sandiegensis]|uniref:Sodium:solute symporter n=1 Tax=Dethiosulfatarculus sandiegensis TaxID=1429043 RepID=A0A0D2GID1_9BACT|nr:sodium:solute symporter family protein [Dethiosulfatarculus sandiegensis]KIX14572.1 sodium:solute symporter [Dethiosulfatarculus sandiegensis]